LNFSLGKEEHLCKNKEIENLIKTGNSSFVFPLKYYWKIINYQDSPVKIAFSVSKKKIKRANKRNRIKRLLRESYRLQKTEFSNYLSVSGFKLQLLVIYISPEVLNFNEIAEKIKIVLNTIWSEINKSGS
jgi:ribonuclease P protein component